MMFAMASEDSKVRSNSLHMLSLTELINQSGMLPSANFFISLKTVFWVSLSEEYLR